VIVLDALIALMLAAGALLVVTGGLGLLRLPDFYTRLHGASVTDTLGAGLILVALAIEAGWSLVAVKLVLIWAFMLFTGPTATHALAKAALHGGLAPRLGQEEGGEGGRARH